MIDYSKRINKTVLEIKPSGIRKFFDIVSDMPDAISLGVGEPDFVTPWGIRNYAIKSIQKGYTAYTSNWGLPALREEIARYTDSRFNVAYSPKDEIIVTVGASEGIDLALRTLVSPGDEVVVPDPSYVSYVPGIMLAGGIPKPVKTTIEEEFKLMPEALEAAITPLTKVLILPYPNNPTGAMLTRDELKALARTIVKHDLMVISDEIYAELTYGTRHVSIAEMEGMRERTVLISGLSKSFAMTGWRVGYTMCPAEIAKAMIKIHQYTILCAPSFSQHAAYYALANGKKDNYADVEEMREKYDMRRKYLVNEFNDMGLECFEPKGAFYVFPSVRKTGLNGQAFAEKLLFEKKVAVVPGDAFGDSGSDCIRCSYACSMNSLQTACERMRELIGEIK